MRVAGFLKVRNEIIREGNLYRVLAELDRLCDGGVICDDASVDGTAEVLVEWVAAREGWQLHRVPRDEQDWHDEMRVKQTMIEMLHAAPHRFDWVFWFDADELLLDGAHEPPPERMLGEYVSYADFRRWLTLVHEQPVDIWAFHYTQPWRTLAHARIDDGFDDGWFWKLWRYRPDLVFNAKGKRLHAYQFPKTYLDEVMGFVDHNWRRRIGREPRAARAPFEVLHLGNVGSQLVLKACQYRGTTLSEASLARHLYFGEEARYRRLRPIPLVPGLPAYEEEPVPFTEKERGRIESLGTLHQTPGLCVVIVPTYNRGYMLDRTLASVLAQTDDHWACIVLDDGSTDSTAEIIRPWIDRDPRFFYCRFEENRGGVAMNEIGMGIACEFGEFWIRLGSDDYFEPHKLALDRRAFELLPDVGAFVGPYRDEHETFLGKELRNPPMDVRGALLSRGFAGSWANIAVRTEVLRAVHVRHGGFCDPRIRNMEDWLANTRIAFETEWGWRGLLRTDEDNATLLVGLPSKMDEETRRRVVHDAIWRIGSDGASQKGEQCGLDAKLSSEVLDAELAKFAPSSREVLSTVVREDWRRDEHGVWRRG